MYRLRARALCHIDQSGNVQIAFRGLGRTNVVGFVRHTHMQGVAVNIAIDGHTAQPKLTAGANDAQSDLATIGNQHLLERPARYGERIHQEGSFDFMLFSCSQYSTSAENLPGMRCPRWSRLFWPGVRAAPSRQREDMMWKTHFVRFPHHVLSLASAAGASRQRCRKSDTLCEQIGKSG